MTLDMALVNKHRAPCPKCGRKGVGYANHPHAFGYRDYDRLECRYCNAKFKLLQGSEKEVKNGGSENTN
ncbi:MAG: hypothetical protein ABFD82_00665 [Syntrophaceae bacterium]